MMQCVKSQFVREGQQQSAVDRKALLDWLALY